MSDDIEFVDGLIVKPPRDGAPDFVKGSLSIKRENLITWLSNKTEDWVNVDIKAAKSGKWYLAVDNWKPAPRTANQASQTLQEPSKPHNSQMEEQFEDDIPFS